MNFFKHYGCWGENYKMMGVVGVSRPRSSLSVINQSHINEWNGNMISRRNRKMGTEHLSRWPNRSTYALEDDREHS